MRHGKDLYRDPERGRIAGVCAGVAEYFGLEIWLVRILALTGFFLLAGPFMLVAYIAAWFILDKKPSSRDRNAFVKEQTKTTSRSNKGWNNPLEVNEEKIEVKSKVWQSGEPPRQAYFDIKQKFKRIEGRLRKVETYVTSSEYQLNREINKL